MQASKQVTVRRNGGSLVGGLIALALCAPVVLSAGPAAASAAGTGTPTSTATVVHDAAMGNPWSGKETIGASAYDTSAVAPSVTSPMHFAYTGSEQTFTVPGGVTTLEVTSVGAPGGPGYDAYDSSLDGSSGGFGAVVSAALAVTPGETLYVEVGGPNGGYNGAGAGGTGQAPGGEKAGGGGGASDVQTCSGGIAACPQGSLLLVAAGGGGGGATGDGAGQGGNGGAAGADGSPSATSQRGVGGGGGAGTSSSPGAGGVGSGYDSANGAAGVYGAGGAGVSPPLYAGGGGGGGGVYGGGGGASDGYDAGGGGGGSDLVPVGGSASTDATGTPSVTISFEAPPMTGSVTYAFFRDASCTGDPSTTDTVTMGSNGSVPQSTATGALRGGSYSFRASYSGDTNYAPSISACEPFDVTRIAVGVSTVAFDAATHEPWSGAERQGSSAYDTATVTRRRGYQPSGSLSYAFFANGTCAGTPATTDTVTLTRDGTVPSSAPTGGLPSGRFSFLAEYRGDADYMPATSACEPFSLLSQGYRLEGGDGGIFAYGLPYRGSVGFPSPPGLGLHLYNFVGMAATSDGYWLAQRNGGVFSFGDARYFGSLPGQGTTVNDVVGIAATPGGGGYWLVSAGGSVYPFGDAASHGSLPALGIQVSDIVAILSPDAGGYWLVGADGAVYAFGDARYRGSCPAAGSGCAGVSDVVSGAGVAGGGYWLVTRSGGVFGFGTAHYHGSCPAAGSGCQSATAVVGIAAPDAGGYWLATAGGAVYAFGDAEPLGSEVGAELVRPIVGIT
jgi:hypothetical protein